jgi:hypothetical protein
LTTVKAKLLPTLTSAGLESAAAEALIEKCVQAVVTILNTFPAPLLKPVASAPTD